MVDTDALLVVDSVDVHLEGKWILRDLSFAVQPGEFVGIIGPNGAGKTTLMRTLLGLLQPAAGKIEFMQSDRVVSGSSLLGYAPQSRQIDPETPLNGWDFVSFGLPRRVRPWLTREERARVKEAMRHTDCFEFATQPIGKLSGGQRQRLFLAQALVRNPQILLLDEPTAALDPGAQEGVAELVATIARTRGIAVLFVSHDVNLIAKHADRVLYLTPGHHVIGSVEEVLQSRVLSRLYGRPVDVMRVGSKIFVGTIETDRVDETICYHTEQEEVIRYVSV
ncbi:metal ABC transporter ATP-binding protein [Tumebacillus flagellatus]|uniref:ABC transporter domain-containing protein n=1 Tax=Tumebacillus flagellatus TaxID=1157490 RepID=A0A074LW51_9BACL|nr:metal ABC transporter ATP-binding protein [Tumebacillus flagellatus]KEO84815.1 hypothetical protein EL26_02045 [Tumebacillus flagellatus]